MSPEDIAREMTWRLSSADDVRGREWIRNAIIQAIEMDRAAREL